MDCIYEKQPMEFDEFAKTYIGLIKSGAIYVKDIEIAYNKYIHKYYSGYVSKLREIA